jgi:hypothetical protein
MADVPLDHSVMPMKIGIHVLPVLSAAYVA